MRATTMGLELVTIMLTIDTAPRQTKQPWMNGTQEKDHLTARIRAKVMAAIMNKGN